MKTVTYDRSDSSVGQLSCGQCGHQAPAWRSSGMSDACPHFYCDRCSNVILRERDRELLARQGKSQTVLDTIAATLPACPCGGRFAPGANPKCPRCGQPSSNVWTPVDRLTDPNMIVLDGACVFSDEKEPYRVRFR